MEPTLTTSIIGILIFTLVMWFLYTTASGKRKVSESKREAYDNWVGKHGKFLKIAVIIISVIYGIGMFIQLTVILSE